mgnify:CR=1 FL=1
MVITRRERGWAVRSHAPLDVTEWRLDRTIDVRRNRAEQRGDPGLDRQPQALAARRARGD